MTSVRRALALSFVERYLLIAIALLGNILIARLLTPEEIGLYSVSLAAIGIAQVLRDFGVGTFLIQEKYLTEAHIRTAFGFALLIGVNLFLILYIAAPSIAQFYADKRMVQTMRISALNFLVLPFCTISFSLLRRDMAFRKIVTVTLSAAVVGFCTTISLAYAGVGPNSMAIGAVAANITTGIVAWLARVNRKLLLPGFSEWRALLNYGGQSSLAAVVTTISTDINDLAIGKILGFTSVAMISRAQGLMNLFHRDIMTAIRNVAFPTFAKAHREGCNLESRYLFSVASITVIAWPFYMFTSVFSLELLRLLFGQQWDAVAPLVPWFCFAGAAAATCNLIPPLLIARNRIDLSTKINIVVEPLKAVILVIGVMAFQSIEGFAILFAVLFSLSIPYNYYMKSKCQPTDFDLFYLYLSKSLAVTIFCSAVPIIVLLAAPRSSGAIKISFVIIAAALSGVTWLASLVLLKHPLAADPAFQKFSSRIRHLIN